VDLDALYAQDETGAGNGAETLQLLDTLERLDPVHYRPEHGARYPESDLGMGLRQVAMLVKADVGLEVACLDAGGWDTHIAQGGSEGGMANLIGDVGESVGALNADLSDRAEQLLVVTQSGFGRRAQENGGLGTDHGHGSALLLLGGIHAVMALRY